ncbi:hypothetical protein ACSBR2_008202 [Camellia fascicularis]
MDTVDKLMNDVREWDVNKTKACIPSEALDNVLKVNLSRFVTYSDTLHWKGSTSGKIKLNTDGCARGDPSEEGFGRVFRDEEGIWLCGFFSQHESCHSLEDECGVFTGG